MKRQIRAHKGGRTTRVDARLTPDEKQALKTILEQNGLSLSDYLMDCVSRALRTEETKSLWKMQHLGEWTSEDS
jgi:uncharacterized protein (DUF1778 family)